MKILFVYPTINIKILNLFRYIPLNLTSKNYFFNKSITFPTLGALTPQQHSIEIVEGGFKDINFSNNYDLVGITTLTCFVNIAYEIADEFRRRNVKVVLGGWHASALPEEAKQHADSVVIGEAEETWPKLIEDLNTNKLKPFYYPQRLVDPSLIPRPRLDICSKNFNVGAMATRGCTSGCDFCSIYNMKYQNKFRMRRIEEVIEDIKDLKHNSFFLFDNSITLNPNYFKQLFQEIKEVNKKFIAYGNIDVLGKDEELLKLARDAGCRCLMVGFESINQETLNAIHKQVNRSKNYLPAIKKIHNYDIVIIGQFMFGFDSDTLDVFKETDNFVSKSEIDVPYFHILNPLPGTPIFNRFEKEGRILTRDWSKYTTTNVNFQPKNMSSKELYDNTMNLNKKHYKLLKCIRRLTYSIKPGRHTFLESGWMNLYMKSLINVSQLKPTNPEIGLCYK